MENTIRTAIIQRTNFLPETIVRALSRTTATPLWHTAMEPPNRLSVKGKCCVLSARLVYHVSIFAISLRLPAPSLHERHTNHQPAGDGAGPGVRKMYDSILALITETATNLPPDIRRAMARAMEQE